MEKPEVTIQEVCVELLAKLQVDAEVGVSVAEEVYQVQIETPEPGILIGYHGRTLESFQLLLGQLIFKKTNEWVRLSVSVGDYRQRREKQLQEIAQSAVERVLAEREPVALGELSPSERRTVHLFLQDHQEVVSESEGEGRDRRLVIKPKSDA
ncbi:KH domain-containing protein [Candidatus Microgenomates bacterium]|nr:MAG: KH domain-containing protein [Candidatus Microgenomates bacterium]